VKNRGQSIFRNKSQIRDGKRSSALKMLQKPKYRVSRANVFASRSDVSSYRNFVPARAILFPRIQFITDYIARCIQMPGADYTFRIRASDTGVAGPRWLKSFAFHFAGLRARKRRIVKLRALTPLKTCLLRGIADGGERDFALRSPLAKIKLCENFEI